MVDVDGVLIVNPDPRGWSANLERDLGISKDSLQAEFFAPHWSDIISGRVDLYSRLVRFWRRSETGSARMLSFSTGSSRILTSTMIYLIN